MKKHTIIASVVIVAIVIIGFFAVGHSNKLAGHYTANVGGSKDTFVFKDDTVTEYQSNQKTGKGTYEIKDGDLKIKLNDTEITAELAKDKKTFKIESTGNALTDMLVGGMKYTKE